MTTETVPFSSINFLTEGQPVAFESRFGNLIGIVGHVCQGEHIGIRNVNGEWKIGPQHLQEGKIVAEFFT